MYIKHSLGIPGCAFFVTVFSRMCAGPKYLLHEKLNLYDLHTPA